MKCPRALTVGLGYGLIAASACNRTGAPPMRESPRVAEPALPPSARLATRDVSGLPEDPVLGKLAEAQWNEHLEREERERQLAFDRPRLSKHRAIVSELARARSRYDRAATKELVSKACADVPRQVERIKQHVNELDPWGVNSRLLGDYAALEELLERDYPDAKLAALAGDSRPLAAARAEFERHVRTIADWLEATEEEED